MNRAQLHEYHPPMKKWVAAAILGLAVLVGGIILTQARQPTPDVLDIDMEAEKSYQKSLAENPQP